MKNISIAYLVSAGVSALLAAFCFYLVYLAVGAQDSGAWLFAAFGLLFTVLPAFALLRLLASRSALFARIDKAVSPGPGAPQAAGFAPHRMLLLAMIVIALIIFFVMIKVISSLF
jgi:hypothetical protein